MCTRKSVYQREYTRKRKLVVGLDRPMLGPAPNWYQSGNKKVFLVKEKDRQEACKKIYAMKKLHASRSEDISAKEEVART